MNTVVLSLLLCAVLGITAALWLDDDSGETRFPTDFYDNAGYQAYKRSVYGANRRLCIPWRSPCTHDQDLVEKYPFLRCCRGLSCSCTMWGNNCRCESRLGR